MTVHVFDVDDAIKYGMEKAVILQNMRFWLEKNKANGKNLHDGYYWTYNSVEAFYELFPYFKSQGVIQRLLKSMEKDGLLLVGNYNKKSYDRTKWYSMPEYCVESVDNSHLLKMTNGIVKNDECNHQKSIMDLSNLANGLAKNDEPIPDINTDHKPDSKPKTKRVRATYKPEKPESVSDQIWNDLLILRKETKASNSQTAWTTIFNGLEKAQQATGHTLDQIITFWIGKAWKGFNADWYLNAQPKPQQTNYQGNNHANHQSANHSNQPKQSSAEIYAAKLAEQRRQRDQAANTAATGCNRGNVYDMEALV